MLIAVFLDRIRIIPEFDMTTDSILQMKECFTIFVSEKGGMAKIAIPQSQGAPCQSRGYTLRTPAGSATSVAFQTCAVTNEREVPAIRAGITLVALGFGLTNPV